MTGNKTLLKNIQMGRGGRITFGDGSQAKVIGKGQIDILGLGVSQKALYVEEPKANLLRSANSVMMTWLSNSPKRNATSLTTVESG
jgi:hypothetical protein